jgi:hypothetical protein
MKVLYYVDENCRDLLELMPALQAIHAHENGDEVKILQTSSEFFHNTGFRPEDKDMYFDARRDTSNAFEYSFFIRNKDMVELLPHTNESGRLKSMFMHHIERFLSPSASEKLPAHIEAEIRHNAAYIMKKYAPELVPADKEGIELERAVDLSIDPGNPDKARHNAVMIAACMRSGKLEKFIKKHDGEYDDLTFNLADDEMCTHIKRQFRAQSSGNAEKVRYVIISNDEPFKRKLQPLFKGIGKDSRYMSSDEFKIFCAETIERLREKAAKVAHSGSAAEKKTAATIAATVAAPVAGDAVAVPLPDTQAVEKLEEAAATITVSPSLQAPLSESAKTNGSKDQPNGERKKLNQLASQLMQACMEINDGEPFFLPQKKMPQEQHTSEKKDVSTSKADTTDWEAELEEMRIAALVKARERASAQTKKSRAAEEKVAKEKANNPISHEPNIDNLSFWDALQYIKSLPPEQQEQYKNNGQRLNAFRERGSFSFVKVGSRAVPYLVLSHKIRTQNNLRNSEIISGARDIIQATLGLTDEQANQMSLEKNGSYYKIAIPDFTYSYDEQTGDPKPEKGRPVTVETLTAAEAVKHLSKELDIPLLNTEETPVNEAEVYVKERHLAPSAPAEKKQATPQVPEPDYSRLPFLEEMRYVSRLPEDKKKEYMGEIPGMKIIKDKAALYYSSVGFAGKPELHLFLPAEIKESLGPKDSDVQNGVRNILQFVLGLKDTQLPLIELGKVAKGQAAGTYKIKIPEITYSYDADTQSPDTIDAKRTATETLSPEQVGAHICDILDIPLKNKRESAIAEEKIKLAPKQKLAKPLPITPVGQSHVVDISRLSLLELMRHIRSLPEDKQKEYTGENPRLTELKNKSAIFFLHNGQKVEPYLFVSPQMKNSFSLSDADMHETVRDVLQFALGLHDEQVPRFAIEKCSKGLAKGLFKVKIPELTYQYDAQTMSPELTEGAPTVTEHYTPVQIAEILHKELDIAYGNKESRPVQLDRVRLITRTTGRF